jgi:hypothetical protein
MVVMRPFRVAGADQSWTFGMTIPMAEIMAPSYTMLGNLLWVVLGGLVLIGAAALLAARMVTKPVRTLVVSLQEIARGGGTQFDPGLTETFLSMQRAGRI